MSEMNQQQCGALGAVIHDVVMERNAQHAKWGEQSHPDGTGGMALRRLAALGHSANDARDTCDQAFKRSEGTYAHILWEEFAEAMECTDKDKLRDELIQVAAVAVAWVEKLDREWGDR